MIWMSGLGAGCSDYSFSPDPWERHVDEHVGGYESFGDGDVPDEPYDGLRPPDDTDEPWLAGVTGRVCDPSGGNWVVGAEAKVTVDTDGDGSTDTVVVDETDVEGRYLLLDLPPGPTIIDITKGSFSTSVAVELVEGAVIELPDPTCLERDSVEIAVVTGIYDDIGGILDALTLPYDSYSGVGSSEYRTFLRDPAAMGAYDIIFLNCGIDFDWLSEDEAISTAIATYVAGGGSLYASDWAYAFVEGATPELIDFDGDDTTVGDAFVGAPGTLTVDVDDPVMKAILGTNSADLYFDYDKWVIPTAVRSDVAVLVSADAPLLEGGTIADAPLAARWQNGQGQVLFTAFHNHSQATIDMETLLLEIVLSL